MYLGHNIVIALLRQSMQFLTKKLESIGLNRSITIKDILRIELLLHGCSRKQYLVSILKIR